MQDSAKATFKKGEILMREGDKGDCAYVLESGNVEILVLQEEKLIQIGTRGPGSLIGEMAMIDDKPRTATVRALDDCRVLRISRDDFARRVDTADPVLKMVIHVIMTRYRDLLRRTQLVSFHEHEKNSTAEALENLNEAHAIALSTIKIDSELKAALARNELMLYYQPIIDLKEVKLAGFEALMRWKHPEKGMISPGIFIPVAEESGFIVEMTKWGLAQSCDAIKELKKATNPAISAKDPLFMSVNCSVKDFATGDLFNRVRTTMGMKSVKPEQIHLEITESLLMEAPEEAKAALEKCRQFGLGVSIDDFGSGYSSLSYLHYFPIDTLKIDQSFVRSMTSHEASRVLVKSIIGLARNLNMRVIAEGIESEEEARILRELGCEQAQGYWFSKPLPFDAALKFAQDWKPPVLSS